MPVSGRIKMMREQCGITGSQLAKLTNWSQSQISKMENGKCSIDSEKLEILKAAMGYSSVPITEEEIDSFKKQLYDFYNATKNRNFVEARENSDRLKLSIEKCFECEFKILYYLFESYLLMCEDKYDEAYHYLETVASNFSNLNDEQSYYYNYFYALCIYKDYALSLSHLLKAEEFAKKIHKQDASLYYAIANIYARIDYSPKAIIYGGIALKLAQNSLDKAYLLRTEALVAFEYSKLGLHQLAIDGLCGCLIRYKAAGNMKDIEIVYHNLGCVYLSMQKYSEASNYFSVALDFCTMGGHDYLLNKLYIAYILIETKEKRKAEILLDELIQLAEDTSDVLLLIKSAKHSLNLANKESRDYIENTAIPQLLKLGSHLKAIDYMNALIAFYGMRNNIKQSDKKAGHYARLALVYTTMLLKGDICCGEND